MKTNFILGWLADEERGELRRIVQAIHRDRRRLSPLDHRRPRLDLPHDLELLAGGVVLDRDSDTR